MAGKYINILLAGLLTILLSACSDDRDSLSGQASGDPLLTFNMTRAGGDIVSNTLARKSTRLNSSNLDGSRMPSSA